MEAWTAGLIGALVGSVSSFAGIWIQSRHQNRRELMKMVIDSAVKDRNDQIELALKTGKNGSVAPVALFVHYHVGLHKLISREKLTTANLRKLHTENSKISRLVRELDRQHREGEL